MVRMGAAHDAREGRGCHKSSQIGEAKERQSFSRRIEWVVIQRLPFAMKPVNAVE
jgi:hypothetical protein